MVNCCPCGDRCTIAADGFNRSTVGSDWTADAGTWAITSDELTTADAQGRIIYNATGTATASMVAAADVTLAADGDQAVIVVAYTDEDHYLYAELTRYACADCSGDCSTIGLYQVDAGTATEVLAPRTLGALDFTAPVRFSACYWADQYPLEGVGLLSATAGAWSVYKSGVTASGVNAGLGTGVNASGLAFDNFALENSSRYFADCEKCGGEPCEGLVTLDLTATDFQTCDFTTTGSPTWTSGSYLDFSGAGCLEPSRPEPQPTKILFRTTFNAGEGEVVTITAAGEDVVIAMNTGPADPGDFGSVSADGVTTAENLSSYDVEVCIQSDGDFMLVRVDSLSGVEYSRWITL